VGGVDLNGAGSGLALQFGLELLHGLSGLFSILTILGLGRGNGSGNLNGDLNFLLPGLNKVNAFNSGNLMNTVLNLQGQLDFMVLLVSVLGLALTNLVLGNLLGETLQNLRIFSVLKHNLHVTELVVKGNVLSEGEHGAVVEDLAGLLIGANEVVFHLNGE